MYRKLTDNEISILKQQYCSAADWNSIEVKHDFSPEYIHHVEFSGKIRLGVFSRTVSQPGGFEVHSGISYARLFNVEIGDDCYIRHINNYIANYTISDNVFIENCNIIVVDGETTFGNGVRVPVLNETGGREIPIYDNLSAHLAYILTLYRHDHTLISRLEELIAGYVETKKSTCGTIGSNVKIINCGTIKNVYIGDYATLSGVLKLGNGSINSNPEAPVHVGSGVKCSNFILSSGVNITESSLVDRCFVGQGSVIGKNYSALDSVFFANCQGFHGEATAVFAGPYTVSHHKSSLLIAGMYSFLNAGSGSNQSNHMYKLGPIHQGIAERGTKTTSDSYLLWPAKIGPFSMVMGRHTKHSDTSNLPFSYLIENITESYLVPAINIRSVGTVRDAQKWPKRDNRTDSHKIDLINFNLLSPYTIQKMYNGVDILNQLTASAGANNEIYSYQGCKIRGSALHRGIELYKIAIAKFLGNSLISRIGRKSGYASFAELREQLKPSTSIGSGKWLDLSGLITPQSEINRLIAEINAGTLSLEDLERQFVEIHRNYYEYEWTWAYERLIEHWNKDIDSVTLDDIISTIQNWQKAVVHLDRLLYEDAKKEFDLNSKTGFGIDGDDTVKTRDFENVRGRFQENPFVKECLNHIEKKTKLGDSTIAVIKDLK